MLLQELNPNNFLFTMVFPQNYICISYIHIFPNCFTMLLESIIVFEHFKYIEVLFYGQYDESEMRTMQQYMGFQLWKYIKYTVYIQYVCIPNTDFTYSVQCKYCDCANILCACNGHFNERELDIAVLLEMIEIFNVSSYDILLLAHYI